MKSVPKVTVIIVNWNGKEILRDCLNSIKATEYERLDVVVEDNGSSDGSIQMIRKEFPWVELIENGVNLGLAKANNHGIERALKNGTDYVFLLNNDTKIIHNDWLKNSVKVAEMNPKTGIVGCKLLFPSGNVQHAGGYFDYRGSHHYLDGNRIRKVDYVTGAAFLIKREVITKIGLFDEHFSPLYFEETDYCARAKAAGYLVIYNPLTTIIHIAGATTTKSNLFTPIGYRNGIRFYMLNYPLSWLVTMNLFLLISAIFDRKDERKRMGLGNIRLKEDWIFRTKKLANAYLTNIVSLPEIWHKRRNRTSGIWN